jgi:hypothetical protein
VIRLGNHFTSSRLSVCALNVATKSSQSILFSIREIVYHVLIYITTRLNRFQFFIDVFRSCFHTSFVNHVVISFPKPSTVAKRIARHFIFGRSRVLTPVPPDQVWFFFGGFPSPSHRGMSHITDKAIAGSVSTSKVPTTFLPHPSMGTNPSRIFPSMWLKGLWKASAARPPSGENERCILSSKRNLK